MTKIQWDQPGKRIYEIGVDRGVLYTPNDGAVPWNGLTGITEAALGGENSAVYFDGVKFAESTSPGDYAATLRAYTYPDEFNDLEGVVDLGNGLYLGNQEPGRFGLSYRTLIGNDVDPELGYKIHILYNLRAVPTPKNYQTSTGSNPTLFEWNITAIPEVISGYRATAHLIFDTRYMDPLLIQDIENSLYGTEFTEAELPEIQSLVGFASDWVIIRITDNFDGTWTADGPDDLITMLDSESFEIIQANSEMLDVNTYRVSDLTH